MIGESVHCTLYMCTLYIVHVTMYTVHVTISVYMLQCTCYNKCVHCTCYNKSRILELWCLSRLSGVGRPPTTEVKEGSSPCIEHLIARGKSSSTLPRIVGFRLRVLRGFLPHGKFRVSRITYVYVIQYNTISEKPTGTRATLHVRRPLL